MEILALTLLVVAGVVIVLYNRLVKFRNYVRDAWAGIGVQLTKRHDLVPLLVKTVQAYASHESSLLQSVTELRSPQLDQDLSKTQNQEESFGDAFSKLLVLAESYPELKADQNFQQLQQQLVDVENDIESARRYYNGTVRELNIAVESFPSNLVAQQFGFTAAEFFKLRLPSIGQTPEVSLRRGLTGN